MADSNRQRRRRPRRAAARSVPYVVETSSESEPDLPIPQRPRRGNGPRPYPRSWGVEVPLAPPTTPTNSGGMCHATYLLIID
ncbi:ORF15 [White sturgeon adenovirus 1]|uniref:ORF15 n=1 Tax=White sturgeon adenovirus 1 TaxID=2580388 RepID=A0A4P8PSB8_9ADEN|nr:ORF15 [White sturgeon adenovirus 1]QCQ84184.1 ORF15 [White sturgeon adenovirus 1]